ncbi:hypothetical protein NADFUDRAFT_44599 [Nadsonia fulvescens var. elongata DSM 6958]|uniref:DNA repair and recombination protein RAD52 n=1 Tax=Nadsonia fulvescens var. elongata DSM 6958 TaxID=857566 RepID=A0A1E3PR27_9ASCO|nr:hypothetical protein NADFUDRAFT_44599 [Nadsonia fulvescens var. elongata DSM 6958]
MPFIGEQHLHHAPGVMSENPYEGLDDIYLPDGSSTNAYTGLDRLIAIRTGTNPINGTGGFYGLNNDTYDPREPTSPFPSPPMVEKISILQARLDHYTRSAPGQNWRVVALANEVFGCNGWSSQIIKMKIDSMVIDPETKLSNVRSSATVRITLNDGMFHEANGFGQIKNSKSRGVALQKCQKEAVTNAIKRAWMTISHILDLMPQNLSNTFPTRKQNNFSESTDKISRDSGPDIETIKASEESIIEANGQHDIKPKDLLTKYSSVDSNDHYQQTTLYRPPTTSTFNFNSEIQLPLLPTSQNSGYAPIQGPPIIYNTVQSVVNSPENSYQSNNLKADFTNDVAHYLEIENVDTIGPKEDSHHAILNNNLQQPIKNDEETNNDINTIHGPILQSFQPIDCLESIDSDYEEHIGIRPVLDEEINISFSQTGEMIIIREHDRLAAVAETATGKDDNIQGYSERAILDEEVTVSFPQQGDPIVTKEYERQATLSQNDDQDFVFYDGESEFHEGENEFYDDDKKFLNDEDEFCNNDVEFCDDENKFCDDNNELRGVDLISLEDTYC